MDNASTIAITDVLDYELVECTWEEFATENIQGGMEIEELNHIESALDKNEPYFIGHGGGGGVLITRLN